MPVRVSLARDPVVAPGAHHCLDPAVDEVVEGLDVLADEAPDLVVVVVVVVWGSEKGKRGGVEVETKNLAAEEKNSMGNQSTPIGSFLFPSSSSLPLFHRLKTNLSPAGTPGRARTCP